MADTVSGERILIECGDITATRRDSVPIPTELATGEVLFRLSRAALTANNVTYAAAGDSFGYWRFFPAPDGYGILPVWGFADAVQTNADGIAPGERFYGYWPLASHLVVQTAAVGTQGFSDAAAHRQGLSDFYNRYSRTPLRSADDEAMEALFRPLFMTGWLINMFLAEADDFGADQLVVSSASSKTALALAYCLSIRQGVRPKIVGLTSPGNRAFVESLGSYDVVLGYDEIDAIDPGAASVYVDFSGDTALTRRVHEHLGHALRYSAIIGMTHWNAVEAGAAIPGPTPTLFFAPSVAEGTVKALGPAGFAAASGAAWDGFVPHVRGKLKLDTREGFAAAEAAYRALAKGEIGGATATVVTFSD